MRHVVYKERRQTTRTLACLVAAALPLIVTDALFAQDLIPLKMQFYCEVPEESTAPVEFDVYSPYVYAPARFDVVVTLLNTGPEIVQAASVFVSLSPRISRHITIDDDGMIDVVATRRTAMAFPAMVLAATTIRDIGAMSQPTRIAIRGLKLGDLLQDVWVLSGRSFQVSDIEVAVFTIPKYSTRDPSECILRRTLPIEFWM